MTIQDNLNRIQQAKSDIKAAIESKGVYVDEADKIDIYASKIYEIEQGVIDIIDAGQLFDMVMNQGYAGPVVVKGTITGIDEISPEYNNATYYVDGAIKVYRGNYLEGMSFVNGDELKIGDYVVVRGTASNYKDTPQMDKYSVIEVLKHEPLLGQLHADFEDIDGEGNYWRYGFDDGFDGFNYVQINASNYGTQKYQEGYDRGKSEGGSGLTRLPATITFSNPTYTELDMTQWDWRDVTDFSTLFLRNKNLERVVMAPIKPNSGYQTFYYCSNLHTIEGLENIDVSNCDSLSYMFGTTSLQNINGVANWDISNVIKMDGLFASSKNIYDFSALRNWDISNVEDINYMFSNTNFNDTDIIANWDTSNLNNVSFIFNACESLEIADLSNWDTTNVIYMSGLFQNCTNIKSVNLSGWNLPNVTGGGVQVFKGCDNLEYINISGMKMPNAKAFSNFSGLKKLKEIDATGYEFDSITSMYQMFYNNEALENIYGLETWDVSNITDFQYMFNNNYALTNIDGVSNWDVSNMTSAMYMFNSCKSITSATLNWPMSSKLTNMNRMFYNCANLETLDLTNVDMSNVTDMDYMFSHNIKLRELRMGSKLSDGLTKIISMFNNVAAGGTFYYNEKYDYSIIIDQLPSTWTVVPIAMDNNL